MRSALPAARAAAVVAIPVALLVAGAVPASAAEATSRSEMAFGLLGPVGLIAVALGIVGMAFGVLRQRRKVRAAAVIPVVPVQPAGQDVTAMAEAVLAEDDGLARPQRP
ncbi:hypothetical protein [Amycolatopsis regifaucium]|uniref:Uncharacterized protein n=1 Tax=Amycolatopsis regifaucium TaxID=546365 RepID=A0A154MD71_9PSEU|nr:hypothetical protein [Amycolatopsis regifaucium]KZB82183.1 hypothetical protein AVL48_09635 [Amycolatopsis regifaucium]OKA05744.1 hypothetical protein ATP06_0221340 [Amycolatopsis regifaucium]